MEPAYDLTDVAAARAFLQDHSANLYQPHGHYHHTAALLASLLDTANPVARAVRFAQRDLTADEALAALTLLADLRDWITEGEPWLIAAARAADATWEELAPVLRVGDRRAAQRRWRRLVDREAQAVSRTP